MAKKDKNNKPQKSSGRISLNKIAFYTLVVAAIILMVQAVLTHVLGPSMILSLVSAVIQIILYAIAGVLGWRYVKNKQTVWKVLYILAALVLIVAVILPIF